MDEYKTLVELNLSTISNAEKSEILKKLLSEYRTNYASEIKNDIEKIIIWAKEVDKKHMITKSIVGWSIIDKNGRNIDIKNLTVPALSFNYFDTVKGVLSILDEKLDAENPFKLTQKDIINATYLNYINSELFLTRKQTDEIFKEYISIVLSDDSPETRSLIRSEKPEYFAGYVPARINDYVKPGDAGSYYSKTILDFLEKNSLIEKNTLEYNGENSSCNGDFSQEAKNFASWWGGIVKDGKDYIRKPKYDVLRELGIYSHNISEGNVFENLFEDNEEESLKVRF